MPERDLFTGVVQLGNLLTRRLSPLFERSSITPQQWAVLTVLAESRNPVTLASVARQLLVSKQNMTGMFARLEQLGLAERSAHAVDRRSSSVQLTRKGRALIEKMRPAYESWLSELAGDALTERDLHLLERSLARLIAVLERGQR